MAYRFNVNIPRTRLRQPPLYRKNNSIAALLPSRKDISYIATTSTEITCGGSAVIRASYSWNIVSGGIVVSDPVILLKLDENTGTNTVDSFGNWSLENFNNNSGWTTGPTAITGNVSALQFNQGVNTNEFLYFSTPKNFPYGNNYTLATWVKIDDIAFVDFQVIFAFISLNPLGGSSYLGIASSAFLASYSDNQSETAAAYGLNTTDHQGKWIHVAITFKNPDIELFIDGVSVATHTNTYPINTVTGPLNAVFLGGFFDPGFEFYGSIDDLRIYSRVLTSTEIQSIRIGREYRSVTTALDLKQIVNATQIAVQGTAVVRNTLNYNVVTDPVQVAGTSLIRNTLNYNIATDLVQVAGTSLIRNTLNYNVVTDPVQIAGVGFINNAYDYNVNATQIAVQGTAVVRNTLNYNVVTDPVQIAGVALNSNLGQYIYVGSSGVDLSGLSLLRATYHLTATSGVELSEKALIRTTCTYNVVNPLITLSGNTLNRNSYHYNTNGGISISGSAIIVALNVVYGDGGATLAGSAPFIITRTYKVSGGIVLEGSASIRLRYSYRQVATDGVALAGEGLFRKTIICVSSGGTTLAGSALFRVTRTYKVSGGVIVSGSFSQAKTYVTTGQEVQIAGESLAAFFSPFDDNFGFIFTLDYAYLDILNLLVKEYYDELYGELAETFSIQSFKPKFKRIQERKRALKVKAKEETLHIVEGQALQPRVRERFSVGNYAREIEKNYRGAI